MTLIGMKRANLFLSASSSGSLGSPSQTRAPFGRPLPLSSWQFVRFWHSSAPPRRIAGSFRHPWGSMQAGSRQRVGCRLAQRQPDMGLLSGHSAGPLLASWARSLQRCLYSESDQRQNTYSPSFGRLLESLSPITRPTCPSAHLRHSG